MIHSIRKHQKSQEYCCNIGPNVAHYTILRCDLHPKSVKSEMQKNVDNRLFLCKYRPNKK